jgi:hypothetical protein
VEEAEGDGLEVAGSGSNLFVSPGFEGWSLDSACAFALREGGLDERLMAIDDSFIFSSSLLVVLANPTITITMTGMIQVILRHHEHLRCWR